MKKYIVETYYTCTFKTVHTLNDLDGAALSKLTKEPTVKLKSQMLNLIIEKQKKSVAQRRES